jgi:U3 small nucleolar RNA-associated protein 3
VEESEEESDEEDEGEEGWGRKKKTYWEGDTADLEIGQEMEDALEEEEAAQDMHREKAKRMKASDFMDEFEASEGSEESDADSDGSAEEWGAKNGRGKSGSATVGDLAAVALGQDEMESDAEVAAVRVEKLTKNISHLSKQQRLDMIAKNSPELLGIVNELKDQVSDLKGRILPLKEFVREVSQTHKVQDDVVDYLEVKQQLLLSYCTNIVFYLYMKAQGRSVANHPVMKQLLKLRYVMEKMRPLDGKLKHQIDRLIQLSEMSPQDLSKHKSTDLLRPNPSALLSATEAPAKGSKKSKKSKHYSDDDDEEEDEEEEGSEDGYGEEKSRAEDAGVYKVPKRTAVPYKESETELDRRDQRLEKQRSKLKRSELMDTLREEFGSAPEAAASSGLGIKSGDLKKLQEEEDERREFEEDRFVRLVRLLLHVLSFGQHDI